MEMNTDDFSSEERDGSVHLSIDHSRVVRSPSLSKLERHVASMNDMSNLTISDSGRGSAFSLSPLRRFGVKMRPPAPDAATLRRQVSALQGDLLTHLEAEQQLQELNDELHQRLELYMTQNHENIERAEEEMNILHDEMEETLKLQYDLSKRASSLEEEKKLLENEIQRHNQYFDSQRATLQAEITILSLNVKDKLHAAKQTSSLKEELRNILDKNAELEELLHKNSIDAEVLQLEENDFSIKIHNFLKEKEFKKAVENISQRALLRRIFYKLRKASQQRAIDKTKKLVASLFCNMNRCRHALHALSLAQKRSKLMEQRKKQYNLERIWLLWYTWQFALLIQKRYRAAISRKQKSAIQAMFWGWHNLSCDFPIQVNAAREHWKRKLQQRAWEHWSWWLIFFLRPKKIKLYNARSCLIRMRCRQSFQMWRTQMMGKRNRLLKLQKVDNNRKLWYQKFVLNRWRAWMNKRRYKKFCMHKSSLKRAAYYCRTAIRCWKSYIELKTHKKILTTISLKHYTRSITAKEFEAWKQVIGLQKRLQDAVTRFDHAWLRTAVAAWKQYYALMSAKKQNQRKAIRIRANCERKMLAHAFRAWLEEKLWRKYVSHLGHHLASWWQHNTLHALFYMWIHAAIVKVLDANATIQSHLSDEKEKCDELMNQTSQTSVENLHVIDRIHALSSEIATLKSTIREKDDLQEELRHTLEDGAAIESSLRGEIEEQQWHMEELREQFTTFQNQLQKESAEDVSGEVNRALQKRNLENAVKKMHSQLIAKTTKVQHYEKAIGEAAGKLEGSSNESSQRLCSAFEIAASLRKLLKDRESQWAELQGNFQRKECEVKELEKKLASSKSTLLGSLRARDSHILELESMLSQRKTEIKDVQGDLQNLHRAIDVQNKCIERLSSDVGDQSFTYQNQEDQQDGNDSSRKVCNPGFYRNASPVGLQQIDQLFTPSKITPNSRENVEASLGYEATDNNNRMSSGAFPIRCLAGPEISDSIGHDFDSDFSSTNTAIPSGQVWCG